jgi:predicted phosphodiesterase
MTQPTANLILVSDLHLDAARYDLRTQLLGLRDEGQRVDAVILLGDIVDTAGGDPVAYAANHVPSDTPAVFIPGNHDFYGGKYGNLINRWRARAKGSHVSVLVDERMEIHSPEGSIVLLGSPLWSNLESLGVVVEAGLRRTLHRFIADFSCMKASSGQQWTVVEMMEKFHAALSFLERELSAEALVDGRRRVVATHFAPHRNSIARRFRDEDISAYFCNHLPELVGKADLWLHGHTHDEFDYQVGEDPCRGRIICHPRGYGAGVEMRQAMSYVPRLIEVPIQRVPWVIPEIIIS